MISEFQAIVCVVTLILTGIWYYLVANYRFWEQLGVPGPKPKIFFGNFKGLMFANVSIGESLKQLCDQFPGAPMVGVYARRTPVLLLRDPELIKDVLIKDFASFSERGILMHEKLEPMSANLINLETKRWRSLRPKLSPMFTSGRMKHMFSLMLECAEHFVKHIDNLIEKDEPIDCRELTAKFTTDVTGSCALGIQINSLVNEDNEYRKIGRRVFQFDLKTKVLNTMREGTPWLYEILGISALPGDISDFFMALVKETMDYRKNSGAWRGDLVDMLIRIRDNADKYDFELTDSLITAQGFIFFLGGVETSATAISHALLELAQHQDVQNKLRQEIVELLEANERKLTYDGVKGLKYLHMVFQETLRLRPPILFLVRKAMRDYTFKGTSLTIPKGQGVLIPIWEMHQNPRHHPDPEIFDPERFTKENSAARHPMTYLPFGDGPRNCIAVRFATYQTKLGLIKILSNYKVEVCEKTRLPFKPLPVGFLLQPVGGVHLKFSKLEPTN